MRRKHFWGLLPILFTLSAFSLGQFVYRLPHVANGANAIQTTFIFFNNGDSQAALTIAFTNQAGTATDINIPPLNAGAVKAFTLGPGETRFYQSDGQGDLFVGSARVTSTVEVGVSAIFSLLQGGGGILTEAGIGASEPTTEFVVAVDTIAPFNTGVAIMNVGVQQADLTFTLYNENGQVQGSPAMLNDPIPLGGQIAKFVGGPDGLFPSLGDFRGKMVVTSTSLVAALTLRQKATGSPLTTLPAVAVSSSQTEFNLPQVANGSNAIKTQFIFFNLGAQPGTISLTLTNDSGGPFSTNLSNGQSGSQFNLNIAGDGSIFVETDGAGTLVTGAAQVSSSVPIGVVAIFSLIDGSGNTTVEAGVGDSPGALSFTIPVDLDGFNTGLALLNLGSGDATITVTFYTAGGQPLSSKTFRAAPLSLTPLGHSAKFIGELEPGASGIGQAAVESDQPLAAVTLRQGVGGTNTLTTLPVEGGVTNEGGGPGPGPGPGSSNLLPKRVENLSLTQNTVLDQQLPAGYKLSGKANLPDGFFPTFGIQAMGTDKEVYPGLFNIIDPGSYEIIVPKGTFQLQLCAIEVDIPQLPFAADIEPLQDEVSTTFLRHLEPNVVVNGDTTKNFDVAAVTTHNVAGQVQGLNKLPPGSVNKALSVQLTSENSPTQAASTVAADGSFEVELGSGNYTYSIFYGVGEDTDQDGFPDTFTQAGSLLTSDQVTVGGNVSGASTTVPDLVELSGKVTQPQNPQLPESSSLTALEPNILSGVSTSLGLCFPQFGASFTPIETNGDYGLSIPKNKTLNILAGIPINGSGDDDGLLSGPLSPTHTFSQNSVLNINLPALPQMVTLSGRVTDLNGAPVADVSVDAFTSAILGAPNATFSRSTTTDAQGNYSLMLPMGNDYSIEYDPPRSMFPGIPSFP